MAEEGKVSLSLNFARPAQKAKPKVSLQQDEQKEERDYIGIVSGRKLARATAATCVCRSERLC